jgi:hypothetical protein
VIYAKNADWIVIKALIDSQFTQATAAKVERIIPDMDFITESENRIWGCSSANHEIYACKQGDAKNWNSFLGISTDSYAVTVGSAGNFTGCCTHLGYVIFFKQNVLHKIYGNKPANYQLTNTACRGVDEGSEKSLVIVNETLFYKSRYDVCAYNSALPASVSQALGSDYFSDAVSGAVAGMLYISMLEASGSYGMYVLDTARGLWYREDDTHVSYFAAYGPDLYFIDDDDKCLYSVRGGLADYPDNNAALEGALAWSAETGDIGMELPDAKYVSKLQLRLEIEQGALLCIEAQYDRSGIWQEVFRINSTRKRSYTVPIIPVRCDTMRLRQSGRGDCVVYSLAKTVEQGSDSRCLPVSIFRISPMSNSTTGKSAAELPNICIN